MNFSVIAFVVSLLHVQYELIHGVSPSTTVSGFQGVPYASERSTNSSSPLQPSSYEVETDTLSLFEIFDQLLKNRGITPQNGVRTLPKGKNIKIAPTAPNNEEQRPVLHSSQFHRWWTGFLRRIRNNSAPTATAGPRQCFPMQCGRPVRTLHPPSNSTGQTKKIVGGTRAEPFSHPWTVIIAKTEEGRSTRIFCGGAVICAHWVLTAAHCMDRQAIGSNEANLDPAYYTVYIGRHAGWHEKFGRQVQIFEGTDNVSGIHSMIQHELYTPGSTRGIVTNDIGLIRLRRPIQFNQYAQPVCLATNPPLINDILWATGWGDTNGFGPDNSELKQIALKIHDDAVCDNEVLLFDISNTTGLLCAGGERNQDTCIGDSGGPLVGWRNVRGERTWFIYGVTSAGSESCNTNPINQQPSLYTNTSHYLPWIQRMTQNCCF